MPAIKMERSRQPKLGTDGEIQDLEHLLATATAPDESLDQTPLYCTNCGTANPARANFCARCGEAMVDPGPFSERLKPKRANNPRFDSHPKPDTSAPQGQFTNDAPNWLSRIVMWCALLIAVFQIWTINSYYTYGAHTEAFVVAVSLFGAGIFVDQRRHHAKLSASVLNRRLKFILETMSAILLLVAVNGSALNAGGALLAVAVWTIAEIIIQS